MFHLILFNNVDQKVLSGAEPRIPAAEPEKMGTLGFSHSMMDSFSFGKCYHSKRLPEHNCNM
jgi:hypothetical protein